MSWDLLKRRSPYSQGGTQKRESVLQGRPHSVDKGPDEDVMLCPGSPTILAQKELGLVSSSHKLLVGPTHTLPSQQTATLRVSVPTQATQGGNTDSCVPPISISPGSAHSSELPGHLPWC